MTKTFKINSSIYPSILYLKGKEIHPHLNDAITENRRNLKREDWSMKKIFVVIALVTTSALVNAQMYAVKKTSTHEDQLNEQYCSPLFRNADGTILDVNGSITAQSYLNILDWVEGRVAGLNIYTYKTGIKIPVIRGSIAKIYVDEIPVDAEFLNLLPVPDIAMIKIIKGPSASVFGANGVVAIYTLQEDDDEEE